MKILVTGGLGNVGRSVVQRLLQHGHTVRVIDRNVEQPIAGAECIACDINDFNALCEQVRGQEGIIHLAALPSPMNGPGEEIFRINCSGTFNVFEAAARAGIHRVSCASSINALGYNFGVKPYEFDIQYFPVDEQHPCYTSDPYSFSKRVVEDIAAYYWRREGISSVCLRLPFVYPLEGEFAEMMQKFAPMRQAAFTNLMNLPEAQRMEKVSRAVQEEKEWRAKRSMEYRPPQEGEEQKWEFHEPDDDMLMLFGYTDFWTLISAQDSAQAFEKGLLAPYEGSYPLFVSEAENSTGFPSEEVARLFFPEVVQRKHPLVGMESLVSFDLARCIIGFEPEVSARQRGGV